LNYNIVLLPGVASQSYFFSGNDNVLTSESDSVENVCYNWIDLSEGGYYHKTL